MKYIARLAMLFLIGTNLLAGPSVNFEKYFNDKTMRVDFYHMGNSTEEHISLDKIYEQGAWAGSITHLIDDYGQGKYYVKVYDAASNNRIYSKGFDDIFDEYVTTNEALAGQMRTYQESALIPYPKDSIRFAIDARDKYNKLHEIFSHKIYPEDVNIIKEPLDKNVQVYNLLQNGDPHTHVDIVFVAEGYTVDQRKKVKSDLKKFSGILFTQEPYKSYKDHFNIYGVFKPSEESGVDEPTRNSFKNTAVNASFNSLGSPRYLLTEDNQSLRDIAGHVPYDAIFVMVNHPRYGGGGIYNLYCTFTTDNQWHKYLFLHEFGHSFAGLGDEYYSSSTSYNDFYPKGVEPTEPNITALLNPDSLKWGDLVESDTPVPTPWGKAQYDSIDEEYLHLRADLYEKLNKATHSGVSQDSIDALKLMTEKLSKKYADKSDSFLVSTKYAGKVGAFEGAGYSSKGLYRPQVDCIMFSKGAKPYCKVCEQAIIRVIENYSE